LAAIPNSCEHWLRGWGLIDFDFLPDEAKDKDQYRAPATQALEGHLKKHAIEFQRQTIPAPEKSDPDKRAQLEAVKRWFHDAWRRIEPKLRTSIVEGISVFLSLFDDNPKVKRIFCPPKECYDTEANADDKYGKPLPSFSWLIETDKVCALNFPIGMNPGLAKAIGVMMKLDFERAVLNRVPQIEAHPEQYFRQVFFICDEYQYFATAKIASELCVKEDQLKIGYNLSETGHDTHVSLLTGKAQSNRANLTTSKTYYQQSDYRFDMKTFTELRNAQSVTIAYDGLNPMPPMFCYLKPYFNDPNKSYFRQAADGEL